MSEFEYILEELGSFGPFQIRVFILVSLFETPAAWAMLLPVFIGAKPDWFCPVFDNRTLSFNSYNSSQYETGMLNVSDLKYYTSNTCLEGNVICPGVIFSDEFTSIVTEWNLICDRSYITNLITTVQMCGVLFGACLAGQLADIFGRRKVLFIYYALMLVMGLASAFSPYWQLYATARFFVGGLVGGFLVVNFVLPIEYVAPKWRTFCGCVGFWAVGLMMLALFAFLIRDWRHLTIVTSVSGVFLLLTWWWIPESPRWLVQKQRFKEAEDVLTRIAIFNNKPVPNFDGLVLYAKKEQEMRKVHRAYSYWHLFKSWPIAKMTLIAMYAWFTSSSVYYGINLNIKNLAGNRYLNVFLSGLVELPALIYVLLVNNRIGRRWTLFSLMLTAGLSCVAILFVDVAGKLESLPLLTILALIGKAGITGGWAASQVASAEIFPTVARNLGIGACSMAARVGGIIAPQLVYLNEFSKPLPYIVFGCFGILCAILVLLLPETKDIALPDSFQHKHSTVSRSDTLELTNQNSNAETRNLIRQGKADAILTNGDIHNVETEHLTRQTNVTDINQEAILNNILTETA